MRDFDKNCEVKTLGRYLEYNPLTGCITWKKRDTTYFTSKTAESTWNRKFLGRQAGCIDSSTGYRVISINNTKYYAHRVALMLSNKATLKGHVDHINGNKEDNRLINLREVTPSQNMKNSKLRTDNKSGFPGVWWDKSRSLWEASIYVDGAKKSLGRFKELSSAVLARVTAEPAYGYHANDGRSQ